MLSRNHCHVLLPSGLQGHTAICGVRLPCLRSASHSSYSTWMGRSTVKSVSSVTTGQLVTSAAM